MKSQVVYTFTGKTTGYSIKKASTGFVFECWANEKARKQGHVDGLRLLVPYGTWGFEHDTDFTSEYNGVSSNGGKLATYALSFYDEAIKGVGTYVKVLRHRYFHHGFFVWPKWQGCILPILFHETLKPGCASSLRQAPVSSDPTPRLMVSVRHHQSLPSQPDNQHPFIVRGSRNPCIALLHYIPCTSLFTASRQ